MTVTGRYDEAITEFETARQIEPLSLIINALKGQALFFAGRDLEALDQSKKTLEIEPNFWIAHIMLARIYIRQNRFDEAVSLAGYAPAKGGQREAALATLEELKSASSQRYIPAYNIAIIYNGLGNREETLNLLEKTLSEHDARTILLKVDPKLDNLRNEPRFIEIMRRLNFE